MNAKVSIIIPTHNRRELVKRAIHSALEQSYTDYELIVVDDGSSDGTMADLQENFPMLRLFQLDGKGVSSARNLAAQKANGEWLAFLDSDDAWHPEKLRLQMQALKTRPNYHLCHTNEIWMRNNKRVNPMQKHRKMGGWIFIPCLQLCLISPSSALINKEIFFNLGGFDESLPACEDYDLWLRYTSRYPVLYLEDALTVKYGGHEDQLSQSCWGMDRFRITALQKILATQVLNQEERQAAINVLRDKIAVYLLGAKKRRKKKEVQHYKNILLEYANE